MGSLLRGLVRLQNLTFYRTITINWKTSRRHKRSWLLRSLSSIFLVCIAIIPYCFFKTKKLDNNNLVLVDDVESQSWEHKVSYDPTNKLTDYPKLWQTSRSKALVREAEDTRLTWLRLNPSLSFEIWDDERVDSFVREFFGADLYAMYQSFPLGVMKADFWRYAILFAEGGIYTDIDTICWK